MKKQIIRLIALLLFASATISGFSGCTVEYREHHHYHHWDRDHDRYHHDHDDDDDYGHDYRDYR